MSVGDASIPAQKKEFIAQAEKMVDEITELYNQGLMSEEERYNNVITTWNETTEKVTKALTANMDPYNPSVRRIPVPVAPSARSDQLAGMRGLIANILR